VTEPARSGDVADAGLTADRGALNGVPAPGQQDRAGTALPYRQPFTWWLRRRGYVLYMIRELTAVPIAIWMVLFLIEVSRLAQGAHGYVPLGGPVFVAFSVVALAAALWHSFTFLNIAGLIMRIPLGDRAVPARAIVTGAFAGFVVVSAIVAALMIWGGA
jgi:succinate dehydrogenase subunit C